MAFSYLPLTSASEWAQLETRLKERQGNTRIPGVLVARLRELGARSLLVETDYVDRDFSEAYSAYYSTTFRRHVKQCVRLLFFSTDLSFVNTISDIEDLLLRLEAATFVGQVVLRPISDAPVAQALLAPPPSPPGYEGHLLVKGDYHSHVWGAELKLHGIPMTQQDSRVGACAQATIWVIARHFHQRHRGPWLSMVSITKAAIANSEFLNTGMLPTGSEAITPNSMVAALRHAGREPLFYAGNISNGIPDWGNVLRPQDVVNRYVDSGIPVIVGLFFPNQAVGHAIVATGQVFSHTPSAQLPANPTRAEYIEAFYVNDDQIGPNIRVAVRPGSSLSEAHYNIQQNALYLIIPLPGKVYLPAEKAETLSWSTIKWYCNDWSDIKNKYKGKLGGSEPLGDEFVSAFSNNGVIARTYLTYGWKYKKRIAHNLLGNSVKQVVRSIDLPRFVYVTEFSTLSETSGKGQTERRIHAHCVVDPTAKNQGEDAVVFMHAPGFCAWYAHDPSGSWKRSLAHVSDSTTYFPKARGSVDFASFKQA